MDRAHRLLGVLVPPRYRAVTAEMFELFKTSWEPVQDDVEYEVILCHAETASREGRRLTIVSGGPAPLEPPARIECLGIALDLLLPWLRMGAHGEPYAWSGPRRLRLGYDVFDEIAALLSTGQAGAAALNANVGRHLEVLRVAMLTAGVPVVEIEAAPSGASLTVAVTHDVDFCGLRRHVFDRTAAGFLYRATFGTVGDVLRGRADRRKLGRNIAAALTLPLVYLGWLPDPWNGFAAYAALDRRWRSTFFIVPRRDHAGRNAPHGAVDPTRACAYQASDVTAELTALERAGFEVGLHGLDAWSDAASATTERAEVQHASGAHVAGVRMHWLYCSPSTYAVLESAGFDYDSTCGSNEAIGFRAGTGQVFRPLGVDHLVELPLIIQDTALFLARRLHLDEEQAFALCARVIAEARTFGGGITLLWHLRSIAPERCWDGFYARLLAHLEAEGAWLAPAAEVVAFYRRRRSIHLDASVADGVLTIRPRTDGEIDPRLQLRVRVPRDRHAVQRLPLTAEKIELAVAS